ncbi:5513_t:CDS:1, partial [Racocetra persica]
MPNKNKIILQYPPKEQYNTIDNIPGSKSRDRRKSKLKPKMEPYQHKFKANGTFEMKKKSRRKRANKTCSNFEQEQEEGTVDPSSQPLNTATSSNFSVITKEKTDLPFAKDSQEFETAEPRFDQNSEVYDSNNFVTPFQDNDFELLLSQSL